MSNKKENFLFEICTEELPPKALSRLATSLLQEVEARLAKAQLPYKSARFYATPRRLAILVQALATQQPDVKMERKGPAFSAAFDSAGNPTPACVGFARSCGVTPCDLKRTQTPQGEWMTYLQEVPGKSATEILPTVMQEALAALPIPKRMRWGSGTVEFVRPVHSVIMLLGKDVIAAEILGVRADRMTSGHRFMCKKPLRISSPNSYAKQLQKNGFVIADFAERKALIESAAKALVHTRFGDKAVVMIEPDLLDEVTGLVEWPMPLLGSFEERFLSVPQEALISAMQDHQRYFPVLDAHGKLMPYFITTSNIASKDPESVIKGNQLVIRARLSDAAFFYETDKKRSLESRVENLKSIVYQAKLGTLFDKAERLAKLAENIAGDMSAEASEELMATLAASMAGKASVSTPHSGHPAKNATSLSAQAARAGLLAKADLTTAMVGEFPELQGIAGYYYAKHDGETQAVALAMKEQYMPRFSGDALPDSTLGCVLALTDRIDTLVGVFGLNQIPTGDKDPFGLRRAAIGVLRIIIEKKLDLDMRVLLRTAQDNYGQSLASVDVVALVWQFMLDRLKPWYQEQAIPQDVFAAVAALPITRPYDFHRRVLAVQAFKALPDAESLSVANKRVSNILAKVEGQISATQINPKLFEMDAERVLAEQLETQGLAIAKLVKEARYVDVLTQLSHLRKPIDDFFDTVMVMAEDKAVRENRLLLLTQLRALFLQVADVALLQAR